MAAWNQRSNLAYDSIGGGLNYGRSAYQHRPRPRNASALSFRRGLSARFGGRHFSCGCCYTRRRRLRAACRFQSRLWSLFGILPLVAYAVFGTSRQLIVNPDAATCAMVAAAVAPLAGSDSDLYLSLSVTLTFLSGLLCIGASFFRLVRWRTFCRDQS